MDYRYEQLMPLLTKSRFGIFLIAIVFCMYAQGCQREKLHAQMELTFVYGDNRCNVSLQDSTLKYEYGAVLFYSPIDSIPSRITHRDVDNFFNDSSLSKWDMKVLQNGGPVSESQAESVRDYLVSLLMDNCPILPEFSARENRFFYEDFKDNMLYQYYKPLKWDSVEISVGQESEKLDFYSFQSIKVYNDCLEYRLDDITRIPISTWQYDSITSIISRINVNSSLFYSVDADDLFGYQIKVDSRVIFQSFPTEMEYDVLSAPYGELIDYIESLSPQKFEYSYYLN